MFTLRLDRFWRNAARPATVVLLALVAYFFALSLIEWSTRSAFDYDARHAYIPHAKRLLNEGIMFLFTEDAVQIPPFSFIFPAVFGADLDVQKKVTVVLSTLNIFLLFRTGQLLHSPLAGVFAVIFYAASPSFKPFLSTGSVEPLYIFLMAVWLWLLAEGWTSQRRWIFLLAGVVLGLAALTRATIVYCLPAMAVAAWWMHRRALKREDDAGSNWRNFSWSQVVALAVVLPVIVKNVVMFGMPSVSTGAGIALFLGSHPLTYGMDPNNFRTLLDNGAVTSVGMGHLEVASDRMLAAVAKHMLQSQSPAFIAEMYAQKLFAFLFVSNREWLGAVTTLRGWRILFLMFTVVAVYSLRKKPVIWLLCALLAYQIIVHIPVLYAHRYSVGALEFGLVLLAGIGFAVLVRERRWVAMSAWLAVTAMFVYAGHLYARDPHALTINAYGSPHELLYTSNGAELPIVGNSGLVREANGEFVASQDGASIDLDLTRALPTHDWSNQLVALESGIVTSSGKARCDSIIYSYRKKSQTDFSPANALQTAWASTGGTRQYIIGNAQPLGIMEPGTLRIKFHCGANARITLSRVEVVKPIVAYYYREQYFRKIGVKDWRDIPGLLPPNKK